MRRQGNPNWGKPPVPAPFLPTGFEQQVENLGLRPGEYQNSPELRNWCRRNANQHYVPEYLLKLWEIEIDDSWGPTSGNMLLTQRH